MTDWSKLHRDVCFGESGGKVLWQPRIGCWYHDKRRAGEKLPEPYDGMDLFEVYRELDVSARLYQVYIPCFPPVEHEAVRFETNRLNDTDVETVCHTPVGTQREVLREMIGGGRSKRLKWWISDVEELRVATWRAENTRWTFDAERYRKGVREYGDLGAPTMHMPRVNIQDFYINTTGVEQAVYMLADHPEEVEAYFAALDLSHDRLIDVLCDSPVEIINYGDNLHAGTLPPAYYEKYVQPAYQRRGEKLHAAGKFVHSHWDGDCKSLLPFARTSALDGIEAITPVPQGDVTLEEVKEALGEEVFLIDGIPAVYFDAYYPVSVLEECVHRILELFAPRLLLGISDEISSTGDIERIRVVSRIVEEYNAQFD